MIRSKKSVSLVGLKDALSESIVARRIPVRAWFFLGLGSVATLFGFLILDPEPNWLLSVCAAFNVAIMGWAIFRLYQQDLLLSPMMLAYMGPLMVIYYSWGNLGARMAGDYRFAANLRTLEFYPLASLLSTIGLILYCWVVFGVFQRQFSRVKIRYQDLRWQPQQLLGAIFFVLAILVYLSLKYSFVGGYFRNAESDFDRWLIAAMNAFIFLIVIIGVSLLAGAENKGNRLIAVLGIILALLLSLGFRSRTFMLMVLVLIVLCWLTLKPGQISLSRFIIFGLAGVVMFSLGTVVKSMQSGTNSVWENISAVSSVESSEVIARTSRGVEFDRQYRAGGFEYPAAVLRCLDYGAAPAYGEGLVGAFFQGLPGFLRPEGSYTERGRIAIHYWRYCFFYDDSIAVPLVSGIGDWGIPGVFIYVLMGIFSLLLWRVAQISPKFFMAYLLVPYFPDYLFWEGVFNYIKTMAFLWLILTVMGSILLPHWSSSSQALIPSDDLRNENHPS